jgi:hypothetical protein
MSEHPWTGCTCLGVLVVRGLSTFVMEVERVGKLPSSYGTRMGVDREIKGIIG